jgi:hypothetical protein
MPLSPVCQVQVNAGPWVATTNGVDASSGDVISIRLADTTSVVDWYLQFNGTDETSTAPALTSVNGVTHKVTTPSTVPTFTLPAGLGKAFLLQSLVTGIGGPIQTTFSVFIQNATGDRVGAIGEAREGDQNFGWITKVNPLIRYGAKLLQGATIPASPGFGDIGKVLTVTGTGAYGLTATGGFIAGGDLSGTSINQSVIGLTNVASDLFFSNAASRFISFGIVAPPLATAGKSLTISPEGGGAATAGADGGPAGNVSLQGLTGGAASATHRAGAGTSVFIDAGDAGSNSLGGGGNSGGDVWIRAGAHTGGLAPMPPWAAPALPPGVDGTIYIGRADDTPVQLATTFFVGVATHWANVNFDTGADATLDVLGTHKLLLAPTASGIDVAASGKPTHVLGSLTVDQALVAPTLPTAIGGVDIGKVLTQTGVDGAIWQTPITAGITALTGDVTASGSGSVAATVVQIQGQTVSSGALTKGRFLMATSTSNWAQTDLSGDVANSNATTGLITVTALQGFAVDTGAPGNGNVLTWNSGTSKWTATAPAGGSGITQLTGDVTAGPGTGSQAATVVKVNGTTVPTTAGGDATKVLTCTGAGSATWQTPGAGSYASPLAVPDAVRVLRQLSSTTRNLPTNLVRDIVSVVPQLGANNYQEIDAVDSYVLGIDNGNPNTNLNVRITDVSTGLLTTYTQGGFAAANNWLHIKTGSFSTQRLILCSGLLGLASFDWTTGSYTAPATWGITGTCSNIWTGPDLAVVMSGGVIYKIAPSGWGALTFSVTTVPGGPYAQTDYLFCQNGFVYFVNRLAAPSTLNEVNLATGATRTLLIHLTDQFATTMIDSDGRYIFLVGVLSGGGGTVVNAIEISTLTVAVSAAHAVGPCVWDGRYVWGESPDFTAGIRWDPYSGETVLFPIDNTASRQWVRNPSPTSTSDFGVYTHNTFRIYELQDHQYIPIDTIRVRALAGIPTTFATTPNIISSQSSFVCLNNSGAGLTVTLPLDLRAGQTVIVMDASGAAAAHNHTISTPAGHKFADGTTSKTLNTNGGSMQFYFTGLTLGGSLVWVVTSVT